MKLSELMDRAGIGEVTGEYDPEITDVCQDSREAVPGSLFVAVKGTLVDGHDYIGKAIEQGAVAVVCEHPVAVAHASATDRDHTEPPFFIVPDSAEALGRIASAWYGKPSNRMTVVGVTGTNGKTTIATLLYRLFRELGYKAGLLSTICNCIDDRETPTNHTTPDALTLHRLMAEMTAAGCEYAFMEVSSHAIDQRRISGLHFDGGIFTNLTRDHLDYHQTVDHYLKTKKRFFDDLPASAFALTNVDDKTGRVMLQNTAARKLTYSLRTMADFKGKVMESHFEGMELDINGYDVYTHFTGCFNAANLLAVYGAAIALGEDPKQVLVALSGLHPVAGRFETIRSPQGFTAIVDYAHTPDALENVLNGIHEVLEGNGRVIAVVGAGGGRDKGKRPLMAKEAARQSDQLILTSDNPRFEDPEAIIKDMEAGLNGSDKERTLCITDRKQAIKTAVALAKKGDVILIAGKGHEDYQEIKGVRYPFDDRETIRELFYAKI
jgi:UDP-N-acetylmuramoyl-L-alanyl-D-glutamate--2,6-diaminopimelate ligase